ESRTAGAPSAPSGSQFCVGAHFFLVRIFSSAGTTPPPATSSPGLRRLGRPSSVTDNVSVNGVFTATVRLWGLLVTTGGLLALSGSVSRMAPRLAAMTPLSTIHTGQSDPIAF